jgi:hypothetical protein
MIAFDRPTSESCMSYLNEFQELTSDIFMYNIFKPVYPDELSTETKKPKLISQGKVLEIEDGHPVVKDEKKRFTQADYTPWAKSGVNKKHNLMSPVNYFNSSDVLQALHIPGSYPAWQECTDRINYSMFANGS